MSHSPPELPTLPGHLRSLDGLRGFAVLQVMILHLWRPETSTTLGTLVGRFTHLGWIGVDLFFVLSGFLITGVLLDGRDDPHRLRNFFARRLLRIAPLYTLFLVATLVLMPVYVRELGLGRYPGYQYGLDAEAWPWYVSYTSNLWMVAQQSFSPGYANSLTWSLAIEEQFYLLWPFVVLWCRPRWLPYWIGGIFVAAVGLRAVLVASGSFWMTTYLLTPCRLDTLATGALLACALRSPEVSRERWRWFYRLSLPSLPLGVGWLLVAGDPVREGAAFQVLGYAILALGWAGLLAWLLVHPEGRCTRLFESWPLVSLGRYSYAIYLFHLLAFVVVYPLVYKQVLAIVRFPLLERFTWLVAGILGSWLLGAALYHTYEKWFLLLKRRFKVEQDQTVVGPTEAPT